MSCSHNPVGINDAPTASEIFAVEVVMVVQGDLPGPSPWNSDVLTVGDPMGQ